MANTVTLAPGDTLIIKEDGQRLDVTSIDPLPASTDENDYVLVLTDECGEHFTLEVRTQDRSDVEPVTTR